MITKQQQLEFAAKHIEKWKSGYDYAVVEKATDGHLYVRWPSVCTSGITKKEWQQEREKMQKQHDFDIGSNLKVSVAATSNGFGEMKINTLWPEVDDSWFTYCKLPPVGVPVELWVCGTFAYNCEFIAMRGNTYVMWNLDADRPDAADSLNSQFRPVRTEREKAIDEIAELVRDGLVSPEMAKEFAIKMHDAGYRKVKP